MSRDIGTILDALQIFQSSDVDLILAKVPLIKESLIDHALNINSKRFNEFVKTFCKWLTFYGDIVHLKITHFPLIKIKI